MRGKHSPNRLGPYLEIHTTIMQQFLRGGFVSSEDLSVLDVGDGVILIEGRIQCAGDIYIDVSKRLEILSGEGPQAFVQTVDYSYNVVLGGIGNVFRYDAPHPDHNQFHHVHRYDLLDGDMHGRVERVEPQDDWPTLGEVISEAERWFYENVDEIMRRKVEG